MINFGDWRHRSRAFRVVALFFVVTWRSTAAWNINLQPKQIINADAFAWSFRGNGTQSDHFKLLERDGQSLLVGARNTVYNLDMDKLTSQKMLEWPSTVHDMSMCRMKGKPEDDCHNYIRVLIKQSNGRVLVCGTNAYKPTCRHYVLSEDGYYQMQREFSGFAISPYDPRHNSTAIYLADRDELYSATVSDFNAADPLIYRKPLSGAASELRTQRNNMKCLHDPNFVSAVEDEEAVYFFLREGALEYDSCGKATFARVARVCKNDQGGTRAYSDNWTTFLKARLNCSLPGNVPLYFDELQAMSTVTYGQYGADTGPIIYGVFTTPYNGVQASAICAFRMADIRHAFSHSSFRAQSSPSSMWLPVTRRDVPSPRPGSCSQDSRKLADDVISFVQKNSLMDDAIPNFFSEPLFIDSNLRWRFTQIAVHNNVKAVNGVKFDVIFVGTSDGRVLKLVNIRNQQFVRTVMIETIHVFASGQSVNNLMVYTPELDNDIDGRRGDSASIVSRLIVVSQDEVKILPLHYCSNRTTCRGCVRLQDPFCAWDVKAQRCVGRSNSYWVDSVYKQAIEEGDDDNCPGGDSDNDLFVINDVSAQPVYGSSSAIYSAESMAIAIILTLIAAAFLGFIVGYRLSVWKSALLSPEYATSSSSSSTASTAASAYGAHHGNRRELLNGRGVPQSKSNASVNLVLSLSDDKTEKNLLTLNNGTLPKDYKVKKVYV